MGRKFRFLGYFLVALSFLFIFQRLHQSFNDIPSFELGFKNLSAFLAAILLCASITFALSLAWMMLLKSGDIKVTAKQAYIIMGKSQIARYLPGNVLHYAGRVVLAKQSGVPTEATLLTTGVETLVILVTAFLIICIGLIGNYQIVDLLYFPSLEIKRENVGVTAFFIAAFLGLFAISSFFSNRFSQKLFSWLAIAKKNIQKRLIYLNIRYMAIAACFYLLIFIILGTNIPLILRFVWGVTIDWQWYQFVWSFTTAWIIGFITPGAPGGLGLREVILLNLYTPVLGEGLAPGISLMLRVVTTLGDLVAFLIALCLDRNQSMVEP